jgi:hypothetical protein
MSLKLDLQGNQAIQMLNKMNNLIIILYRKSSYKYNLAMNWRTQKAKRLMYDKKKR